MTASSSTAHPPSPFISTSKIDTPSSATLRESGVLARAIRKATCATSPAIVTPEYYASDRRGKLESLGDAGERSQSFCRPQRRRRPRFEKAQGNRRFRYAAAELSRQEAIGRCRGALACGVAAT